MKSKLYLFGILSMLLAFSACSEDDPVSVIEQPEEEAELDSSLFGEWVLDPTEGSLAVGPSADDLSWWQISADDVENRGCLYDDLYIFNEDGSFENFMGEETWLEGWQGAEEEACGTPVAPHDNEDAGSWSVDGNEVSLAGGGSFLGLAKVTNNGEGGVPADGTVTYEYTLSDNDQTLEIFINFDPDSEATWYYRFIKQ